MFGFISKKRLIEVAVDIYYNNHSNNDMSMEEFRFQCGVAKGLDSLCDRFGIDLPKEVRKDKRSAETLEAVMERARRIMTQDSEERSEGE
jgi:hypothetical protein